jgi:microsomal dipeptidase-like Zn-dependent dipeptidase
MLSLDWQRIHREATIVDLHVHPSMQQQLFRRNLNWRYVIDRTLHGNPMSVRASFPRLHDGGFDVIFSTVYVPERGILKDFPIVKWFRFLRPDLWRKLIVSSPYDATLKIMDDMEAAVASSTRDYSMKMARSVAELETVLVLQKRRERPIAVIHAVEGCHSLGYKEASDDDVMNHLEALYQRGVISITLAHFYPNRVVNPCYPFPEDIARLAANPTLWRDLTLGLTDLGKRVVERMIELGMLIDLSHSTPVARRQVYDIVDASGKRVPLIASHVGAYAVDPSPYNMTDWEIQRIARDGGVIGVIFMPYWLMPKESGQGINFISRHIQYLVDTGGEDVVGIGTDFDGFTTPPDDLDNASQMPRLTQRLVVDGHSEARIKKILGGNALRAIRQGWGKKT